MPGLSRSEKNQISNHRRHIKSWDRWPHEKWRWICIINVDAGREWLPNPPVFLRLQLHDWGRGKNSVTEWRSISIQGIWSFASDRVKTQSTSLQVAAHLHRLHGGISIVMDRLLLLALWARVSESSNVDHVTVVKSNKDGKYTRGRMHWDLQQARDHDSPLHFFLFSWFIISKVSKY